MTDPSNGRNAAPCRRGSAWIWLQVALSGIALAALPGGCSSESSPGDGHGKGKDVGSADQGLPDAASDLGPAEDLGDTGAERGYREPCQQNADCQSGWCVPYAGSYVCSRPCNDDCEGGWLCRAMANTGSDPVFICMPPEDRLCTPCVDDADCAGGLCWVIDPREGVRYCVQPCLDGECREGFGCTPLSNEGESLGDFCLPATGTCSCTPENRGMKRLCTSTSELGSCLGQETCVPEEGWMGCTAPAPEAETCNLRDDDCNGFVDDVIGLGDPCVREAELPDGVHGCRGVKLCDPSGPELRCTAPAPVPEVCNLRDDDCDGEVDEDFPELGQPCSAGVGACLRIGAFVCNEQDVSLLCTAVAGDPQPEACNYIDDDCDGLTDEDFREQGADLDALARYVDLYNCGACGHSCEGLFPHATARCDGSLPLPACVVEACEAGYYQAGTTACLPLEDPVCQLCSTDLHCQLPGNRCLELDGGRYCGRDCALGNVYGTDEGFCPEGFVCQPLPELGEGVAQCLPLSGSCSCRLPEEAGATRSCLSSSELGSCPGLQTCDPQTGWSACSAVPPVPEQCNGVDDDCDGAVDDGLVPPEEPCEATNEQGTCTGEWSCAGEQGWRCSATEPLAEACNYLDDDCDGATDEDFRDPDSGASLGPDDCGRCGFSCAGAVLYAASTTCALEGGAPACVATTCEEGFHPPPETRRICLPEAAGFDCSPCLTDEHCAGMGGGRCEPFDDGSFCTRACEGDAGCSDGFACTDGRCLPLSGTCTCLPAHAGATRYCVRQNELGGCVGLAVCTPPLGWTECSAPEPLAEECNALDDDCDGQVDEDLQHPGGVVCEVANPWGTCSGAWFCAGAEGWRCTAATPAEETCDYRDEDCDGQVDEGFRDAQTGLYGSAEHCGMCGFSCAGRIPHASEMRCATESGTPTCVVAACEAGFFRAGDFACVPVTSNRCAPCLDDRSCPVLGDRCLLLDGQRVCGQDCSAGNLHGLAAGTCPAGFTCTDLGGGVQQCVPISGSCSCLAEHAGNTRWCSASNELGTCTGFETCDPLTGWEGCSATLPAPELCDERDNDCDGAIDEGFGDLNQPCSSGEGSCRRAGVMRCAADGLGTTCAAEVALPQVEACNYLDDDCDGRTDEDFRDPATGLYDQDEHCGLCNNSCEGAILYATQAHCTVEGVAAFCLADACEEGFVLAAGGRMCMPPSGAFDCSPCAEDVHCESLAGGLCERFLDGRFCTRGCALDADCPESFECVLERCWPTSRSCTCLPVHDGDVRVCFESNESGTCMGTQTCDALASPGWSSCSAAMPAAEACDGLDNDCNGLTDEGLVHPEGPVCSQSNDWGSCLGVWQCTGAGGWRCSATMPAQDLCNGSDDDCDGQIDEDFPALLQPCFVGEGACRTAGVARCSEDGLAAVCQAVAGEPSPELCDGLDNDCDGATDEDFPGLGSACTVGEGACKATGVVRCSLDGSSAGCSAEAGEARPESCNGLDDDCDGQIDEDFPSLQQPCFAGEGACRAVGVARCNDEGDGTVCLAQAGEPSDELCDAVDNDCDGFTDEDFPDLHRVCVVGQGICTAGGVVRCLDLHTAACSAQQGDPLPESCNGLDDDCDGEVDEDFKVGELIATFDHCGSCGRSCAGAIPNGTARCAAELAQPRCVVDGCNPGYVAVGDDQCLPLGLGQCDPCLTSEDCIFPGARCTELTDGTFCVKPCAVDGDCPGGTSCTGPDGEGSSYCMPASDACLCDGSDLNLRRGCQVDFVPLDGGQPYSCFGIMSCEIDGWSDCALPEEHCNSLDDDCDGLTDEGFYDADGRLTTDENCGECGNNCKLLVFPGGAGSCNTFADPPRCSVSCNENCFDVNVNPGDGCECCNPQPFDLPDPLGIDANCDGMDGEKDNGIFVAKDGDDANDGSIYHPKLTIQAGIDAAVAQGKRDVYVATGVYGEVITLAAGKGVYGGYSSDYRVRNPILYEAAILAPVPPPGKPGAVNATDIRGGVAGTTVFAGFSVFGYTQRSSGASSYAVYVRNCDDTLRIEQNRIHGGVGGPGSRGTDGEDGAVGAVGTAGTDALDLFAAHGMDRFTCTPDVWSPGGEGGSMVCAGTDVSGGSGGNRVCPRFEGDQNKQCNGVPCACPDGSPIPAGTCPPVASEWGVAGKNGDAAGGAPGRDVWHQAFSCDGYNNYGQLEGLDGEDGPAGMNGDPGQSCSMAEGIVVDGQWVAGTAGGGTSGLPGGGGGGGGSGGGAAVHTSCQNFGRDNLGGTGGGGGSGGCAGTAGGPGTSGGGAFGIFVVLADSPALPPQVTGNILFGGFGGPGGDGGNAGVGGAGGAGSIGGYPGGSYMDVRPDGSKDPTYPSFKGGKGGKGGNGGHGGGGGGGCGGPAFDIYVANAGAAYPESWKVDNSFVDPGQGGPGGLGGFSLGNPGERGLPGAAGSTNF